MRISYVKIKNYRNLDDTSIVFDPDMNFLVGENDLGKSNVIDMLFTIFNGRRFFEDDFTDIEKAIEIEFSIILSDIEKGVFDDYLDPDISEKTNVTAKQESIDEDIRYFHLESGEEISYFKFRCLNYIKYDSLRTPKEELTFHRKRGVGKFLGYLVERCISQETPHSGEDFINKEVLAPIVEYINSLLKKIRMLKEFDISATAEEELNDLIFRILTIKDNKGFHIQKIGYGVQFSVLIVLSILEKLMLIREDKRKKDCIFSTNEESYISLILGLDEPEIHLHPYMQRSIVKYIKGIIQNEDDEFVSLVKVLFDIDKIDGQAIIVSHSPTILLNQYRYVVRFYRENSKIKIISGSDIRLDESTEKHLLKNFSYIKEALFSRCAILVEGDTEYAALPLWSEKLIGDLDQLGISVIQVGGSGSIPPVSRLLDELKIPNVSIVDRDCYENNNTYYEQVDDLIITDHRDFEEELVEHLISKEKEGILFEIVMEREFNGLDKEMQNLKIIQIADKYEINVSWEDKNYSFLEIKDSSSDKNLFKAMFLSWLDKKSILLGRTIGEIINKELIPNRYKETIEQAKINAK